MTHRSSSLVQITCIYLALGLLGTWVFTAVDGAVWMRCLVADIAMTVAIYAVSVWKKNTSAYDAYWSVIPFMFLIWLLWDSSWTWSMYQWFIALAVSFWSWRLTLNWSRAWPGWEHEDWRYVGYREQLGSRYELMNFFGLQFFPTLMVFGGFSPLFWTLSEGPTGAVVLPGVLLMLLGTMLELVADNQLHAFRIRPNPQSTDLLDTGLWGVVRHPNYLGELLFWFGTLTSGLANGAPWFTGAGALVISSVVLFASIPFKDTRMAARRPDFGTYREATPAIIPGLHWP